MKRKNFLIITLFFLTKILFAQPEFRPGYIITSTNDTIRGEIDFRNDKFMSEKCRFKNKDGDVIFFTPEELSGYRILNSKYFVSRTINGKKEFLEFLINGQINIYYNYDNSGPHYFLEKVGNEIIEMRYKEEIIHKNGLMFLNKSKDHIRLLTSYMKDAPELQSAINKIEKPEHSNLIKLAEDYHKIVCKDQACIIYEKKMRSTKLEIELQGGIVKPYKSGADYGLNNDYVNGWYYQTGIIFHLSSPMISEKYILKAGIQYSQYKEYDIYENIKKINVFNIPIGIEYFYPRGIIRPTFACGVNIYHIPNNDMYDFSFGAGLNFKISNSVFIVVNSSIDIFPDFLLLTGPVQIDRYSFSTGLRFKL